MDVTPRAGCGVKRTSTQAFLWLVLIGILVVALNQRAPIIAPAVVIPRSPPTSGSPQVRRGC
jgi:hypothetical protein